MRYEEDMINDLLDRVETLEEGGGGGGGGSSITVFNSREEYEQAKASGLVKDGEIVGYPGVMQYLIADEEEF